MTHTRHAKERSQERGIPVSVVDLIVEYGTPQPQPDGTCKYVLQLQDRKAAASQLHQQLQYLEKAAGKEVVVSQSHYRLSSRRVFSLTIFQAMSPVPSLEEVKSELAAVKERIPSIQNRIDRLSETCKRLRGEERDARARNQKEELAQVYNELEKREKCLKKAKSALKQLKASREALTAQVRRGKPDEDLSFSHLNPLQMKRLVQEVK